MAKDHMDMDMKVPPIKMENLKLLLAELWDPSIQNGY
jgi:hypothetical protein